MDPAAVESAGQMLPGIKWQATGRIAQVRRAARGHDGDRARLVQVQAERFVVALQQLQRKNALKAW